MLFNQFFSHEFFYTGSLSDTNSFGDNCDLTPNLTNQISNANVACCLVSQQLLFFTGSLLSYVTSRWVINCSTAFERAHFFTTLAIATFIFVIARIIIVIASVVLVITTVILVIATEILATAKVKLVISVLPQYHSLPIE